jgi:hypothetical protein
MTAFDDFTRQVLARLEKGRLVYGDRSFDRFSADLLGEIEEELLDVCGWSFVLWSRLRRLRSVAEKAEHAIGEHAADEVPQHGAPPPFGRARRFSP